MITFASAERVSILLQQQHQQTFLACASAQHVLILFMDSTN